MLKQKSLHFFTAATSLALYLVMGYEIERHQTIALFSCYFSLFILYLWTLKSTGGINGNDLKFWLGASVIFRLVLLFPIPALSDDFYRFLWDGRLLAAGYHPFAEVPSYYITNAIALPGIDIELFNKLNSKETFTIYPPFVQSIFWISVKLSDGTIYGSLLIMKAVIITFELATLWLFGKVLHQFNQRPEAILIYALNPLVVLELTGNVHHEGVMVFFLLLAILLLRKQRRLASAVAYALSICTKLIPILFMPLLFRYLGWKKTLVYAFLIAVITLLLFVPLLDSEIVSGFSTSLRYYFQRFEFNASIYYVIRQVGYIVFGFNIIQFSGPILGVLATIFIFTIAFRNFPAVLPGRIDKGLFEGMLWALFIYFVFTTILHPWYIITLLAICIFTPYRFPVIWTGLIFLTYAGYTAAGFKENLFLIAMEYSALAAFIFYETVWTKRRGLF